MPLDPMEFSLTGRDKVACKDCPVAPAPVEGEPPVEPAICPTCGGKKVVLVEHDYLCKPHRPDAGIRVAAGVAALAAEPLAALAKSAVREMDLFELVESDAGMPLVMDAIGRLDSEAIGAAFRHALDVLDPALMRAILANTWRDGKPLSDEEVFDEAYTANFGELLKAVWKVGGFNSFFGPLGTS